MIDSRKPTIDYQLSTIDWFKDWFADSRYLELYQHRDDKEADALVTLIEQTTGSDKHRKILDIACGAGRHLISFAHRGYTNLHGHDISRTLIDSAKQEAGDYPITFAVRDMRDPITEKYDLILNIFTSFGYFASDAENEHVIANCAQALVAGGHFVLDYFNVPYLQAHLVAHDHKRLPSGAAVELDRKIAEGRVIKHIRFEDGTEFIESVRLYTLKEIEQMFVRAHLVTKACFGSYAGDRYDEADSPRLILVAEKK